MVFYAEHVGLRINVGKQNHYKTNTLQINTLTHLGIKITPESGTMMVKKPQHKFSAFKTCKTWLVSYSTL